MDTSTKETVGPGSRASQGPPRPPASPIRQALRLTRTEFTLMYRYRTALFFVLFPLIFVYLSVVAPGESAIAGTDAVVFAASGTPAVIAMMIGIMHVSNIYAARREQLILKRFRVSGVSPFTLFTATTLSVLTVVLLLSAVVVAALAIDSGELPTAPAMVALTVLISGVTMSLLGAAITALVRNAEAAQMMSMLPFLVLYLASGLMMPLEVLPENLAAAARLLPMAPAVELLRAGYLGYDVFGGVNGAEPAAGLELWAAALPSLAVVLAWLAISVFSLRYFRWDPRQQK